MKTPYSREPVDFKLLLLITFKRLRFLIYGICLGAIVFGGMYYLVRTMQANHPKYEAISEVYLKYKDEVEIDNIYINQQTWAQLIYNDLITQYAAEELGNEYSEEVLREKVSATLLSSTFIVTVTGTSYDEEEAIRFANAYANAIVKFCPELDQVREANVFKVAKNGEVIGYEDRTLAMTATGALVGGILTILFLGLYFVIDDSIYIPGTVEIRYGFPALGLVTDRMRKKNYEKDDSYLGNMTGRNVVKTEFYRKWIQVNYKKITAGKKRIAVVGTSLKDNCDYVMNLLSLQVKELKEKEIHDIDHSIIKPEDAFYSSDGYELTFVGSVNDNPQIAQKAAEYDGVIVLLKAGDHNGKLIERALDLLRVQGADVIGAILYEADAGLTRRYVFSPFCSSTKILKEEIYNELDASDIISEE